MRGSIFQKKHLFLLGICFLTLFQGLYAGEDDGESVYFYKGIPGCGCFSHCSCLNASQDNTNHPRSPEDLVWHTFVKEVMKIRKVGPCLLYTNMDLYRALGYYSDHDLAMLSEYLNAVPKFKKIIIDVGNDALKSTKSFYPLPKESKKYQEETARIQAEMAAALAIIEGIPSAIIPLYKNILSKCTHNESYNLALIYNGGLIDFLSGDYEDSLNKISTFIAFAETSYHRESLLQSEIYQKQGESYLEVGRYHQAIEALTKAIEKDPKNKQAYFGRANAYFETGNFDQAIHDYLASEIAKEIKNIKSNVSTEFSSAILTGLMEGGKEAALNFAPSLCHSAYGLGECLWTFAQNPVEATINFSNVCYEVGQTIVDTIKSIDQEKLEEISSEVHELALKFDSLSDTEKGQSIGYCIGKYGVDIFAGGAVVKSVSAVKKLKDTNRLCNLEALATSETNKQIITTSAIKHADNREAFFKNVKIHQDRQNKHIPGKHNYEVGKSIFEHKTPEKLVREFAGKGTPLGNRLPGTIDYRERVDFKEFIGYHINEKTGIKTPTTWGEIRYSKNGAHIVPAFPE